MESWHWAIALRPFFTAAVLVITGVLIVYPLRRWLPDGKLKNALLWKTNHAKGWKVLIPLAIIFGLLAYITWMTWDIRY
jgi:hypothetical protein